VILFLLACGPSAEEIANEKAAKAAAEASYGNCVIGWGEIRTAELYVSIGKPEEIKHQMTAEEAKAIDEDCEKARTAYEWEAQPLRVKLQSGTLSREDYAWASARVAELDKKIQATHGPPPIAP
jgi:hypothetical protein